jgi:hypothetical protein
MVMRKAKAAWYGAALAAISCLPAAGVEAKTPSACVGELQKQYGGTPALRSECASKTDCTFQAPEGNASALALVDTIAKRAESCLGEAGLTMTTEETITGGSTRYYGATDASEKCALLVATANGATQGVRLTCQPAK